jgi:hypothetical protein
MMVAQFIFVPVGGTLVSVNPWIPMLISSVVTALGFLGALIFLPETLPRAENAMGVSDGPNADADQDGPDTVTQAKHGLQIRWRNFATASRRIMTWVRNNVRILLVAMCFFPCSIGQQAGGSLLLQYASKRLDWSLGKVIFPDSL